MLNELVKKAHHNAVNKGFWEDVDVIDTTLPSGQLMYRNAIATRLMLIVTEVSEAMEALREDDFEQFHEEVGDILIRCFDLAGGLGIDLDKEVTEKMKTNEGREYKHGKQL